MTIITVLDLYIENIAKDVSKDTQRNTTLYNRLRCLAKVGDPVESLYKARNESIDSDSVIMWDFIGRELLWAFFDYGIQAKSVKGDTTKILLDEYNRMLSDGMISNYVFPIFQDGKHRDCVANCTKNATHIHVYWSVEMAVNG